jgi:hypothetical protein
MGSANCRSYSRNKRGIAGSLIWINFDRHSLLNLFKKAQGKFVADQDEIRPQYQDSSVGAQAVFTSSLTRTTGPSIGATIDQIDTLSLSEVGGDKELASPWYSDQILPFDVTIAGANEYGAMAAAKIFAVEILNEGWGSSIDDAVSEMQVTYVAPAVGKCKAYQTYSSPASPFLPPSPNRSQPNTPESQNNPRNVKKSSNKGRAGRQGTEGLFLCCADRTGMRYPLLEMRYLCAIENNVGFLPNSP